MTTKKRARAGGTSAGQQIEQVGLYDLWRAPASPPAHHAAPPGTSDAAARRIAPVAGTLRAAVRDYIAGRGWDGATDAEITAALGIPSDTTRPRRRELVLGGAVCDSGRRRATPSGCRATVWVAIAFYIPGGGAR